MDTPWNGSAAGCCEPVGAGVEAEAADGLRRGYVTRRKSRLLARLRRVEGQIRGVQRMIEEDVYCADVLTQIAAARAALDRVGLLLLEDHTRGCVARALREGTGGSNEEGSDASADVIEEMVGLIHRFVR